MNKLLFQIPSVLKESGNFSKLPIMGRSKYFPSTMKYSTSDSFVMGYFCYSLFRDKILIAFAYVMLK